MEEISGYSLLGDIDSPAALRRLPADQLPLLAKEIRRYLIETLGRVGGHFSANLGTVELTLALHRVLDTPHDRLVWDVGHQAYAHKMLTGRRARLESIRKLGGLAAFLVREESEFDAFGGGHAGTAISAAAGIAAAVRIKGERRRVAAVIGDGGLTAGLAFEALNHIGAAGLDVLVIGNDNDMSISENVGALRDQVARQAERQGIDAPHRTRPPQVCSNDRNDDPADFFCSLGFTYHGPIDGHDLFTLESTLQKLKDARGPQFLHVITMKGKGFVHAEADPIGYHGVTRFDPVTGAFPAGRPDAPQSYSAVFGDWLCAAAERDPRVVAITPAMREGSGLAEFARRFPDRYFDVGIAEQHAVTLAAGLAVEGMRPVVAIYSTFLQRAYDQLIHDVAIQKLPVLFAIDRAGLVGPDGATHHGAFDLAYLRCVPNLTIMAPSSTFECRRMLDLGLALQGPSSIRYPRGAAEWVIAAEDATKPLEIGKARILREARGRNGKLRIALLALGPMVGPALEAAEILDATVGDLRFVKPLDEALILKLAACTDLLVTIEDHVTSGGFGSAISELLGEHQTTIQTLHLGLPDSFIEHGTREELLSLCGLDPPGILRAVQTRMREGRISRELGRGT